MEKEQEDSMGHFAGKWNKKKKERSPVERGVSWRTEGWPPAHKTVLVWLSDKHLPFCGYMKFAAGDKESPYWIVYHGNSEIGADVIAWCDCLPDKGPKNAVSVVYERGQAHITNKLTSRRRNYAK